MSRVARQNIGRKLILIAGLFPLIVGIYFYVNSVILSKSDPTYYFISSVAFANLMVNGVVIIFLALNAKLEGGWAWWLLLVICFGIGVHDSIASILFWRESPGVFWPIPFIPTTLTLIGLFLTRKRVVA